MSKIKEYIVTYQPRFLAFSAFILISIFLGMLILAFDFTAVIILTGLCLAIIIFFKPQIGILAIIVIISSIIFEEALPLVSLGSASFHVTDVMLIFLLVLIPFKLFTDKNFSLTKTHLDLPLSLFYFIATISAITSILYHNVDFKIVMRLFRHITYYLIFFTVTNFVRDKNDAKFLIKFLFLLATLVGGVMIVQAIVGESVQLMPGRVEATRTLEQEYSAIRILPPGQDWIYVSFISVVCAIAFLNKPIFKSNYFYMLIILGIAILLTYNRNYWIAIVFSLGFYFLLITKKSKKLLLLTFSLLVILATITTSIFLTTSGKPRDFIVAVSDRASSLFSGKTVLQSNSLEWRKTENKLAIKQILENPFIGIGLANNYRPENIWTDGESFFMHNSYLWILLNMGIIGFASFFWFYLRFIKDGLSNWKNIKDGMLKTAVIGFTLSGIGILLAAIVNPMFMKWYSIVVITTIIGLTETIIKINQRELADLNE